MKNAAESPVLSPVFCAREMHGKCLKDVSAALQKAGGNRVTAYLSRRCRFLRFLWVFNVEKLSGMAAWRGSGGLSGMLRPVLPGEVQLSYAISKKLSSARRGHQNPYGLFVAGNFCSEFSGF